MKIINNNDVRYLVTDEGTGIIRCEYQAETRTLFLSGLVVDYEHRRQNIGTQLMRAAIDLGKELDCLSITLQVAKNNQWLKDWYQDLGFTFVGEGYYEEYYLMSMFPNKNS